MMNLNHLNIFFLSAVIFPNCIMLQKDVKIDKETISSACKELSPETIWINILLYEIIIHYMNNF